MRPRAFPSPRVKVNPWYFPRRHKQPGRAEERRQAVDEDLQAGTGIPGGASTQRAGTGGDAESPVYCPVHDDAPDPTLGGELQHDGAYRLQLRGESERRALRRIEHRRAGGYERCNPG